MSDFNGYVKSKADRTVYTVATLPDGDWGWVGKDTVLVNYDGKKYLKPAENVYPDFRKEYAEILVVIRGKRALIDTGSTFAQFLPVRDRVVVTTHMIPIVKETDHTQEYLLIMGGDAYGHLDPAEFWGM